MEKVTEINDLGVVFDRTFKSHIDYIVSKANINLGFDKHYARKFSDHYIYKILFTSFVRSKLEFAVIVWNPYYNVHINRINLVIQG